MKALKVMAKIIDFVHTTDVDADTTAMTLDPHTFVLPG